MTATAGNHRNRTIRLRARTTRGVAALLVALLIATALGAAAACSGGVHTSDAGSGSAPRAANGGAERAPAGGSESRGANAKLAADKRAVVYTASLSVRARRVGRAVARAKDIVFAAHGYVADEETSGGGRGQPGQSHLELKVPVARYQPTLRRLGHELGKRLSLRQSSNDETQTVQDVSSRVASAKASLKRLRKLLGKADSVREILRVEGAISSREASLESLQARSRSLNRQTSYATINLDVAGPVHVAHKRAAAPGFLGGLRGGWHALLVTLRVVVAVIGALLPFAAVAALVGIPAWWLWRRRRRRMAQIPEPTGQAE